MEVSLDSRFDWMGQLPLPGGSQAGEPSPHGACLMFGSVQMSLK